jgi:hypothetical protein
MLTYADGPDMHTSLAGALVYLVLGVVLVVTFYVLRAKARRKVTALTGRVFEQPWAPLVRVEDGDVWRSGAEEYMWQHDRWIPVRIDRQHGTWRVAA